VTIEVANGGLLTTVQDRGRFGHQADGVPVAGPMDALAHRCANMLVGNDANATAIEITIVGPVIRFTQDALIALGGAELGAALDAVPFPPWRAAGVRAGTTLSFRGAATGCHAYLAIAGGIDVPRVLGSRSTYLRGGFGGMEGRALRAGDVVRCDSPSPASARALRRLLDPAPSTTIARWSISPTVLGTAANTDPIRLIRGEHEPLLTEPSRERLFSEPFRVSTHSDRMGYRLSGTPLELRHPTELLSEGVTFGTVQLPPGGNPIILMADRQTTGGYPRIGEVASIDLPRLAQRRPGDLVRFQPIELDEAQRLLAVREVDLALLTRAIMMRHEAR
jgi:antagonist of KipI